jgi:hypothetical protein
MTLDPEQLFAFIRREIPPPLPPGLSVDTDLRHDLRMAEEDADEFLAKLFQEFSIAPGDFDFTRYFPSEGLWLFGRKRAAPAPLTLGMLLRAARDGVWDTATIEN